MLPSTNFVQLIKKCAMEAYDASKPTDYLTGNVISTSPLKIQISQNMVLSEAFLEKTRNVTKYDMKIKIGESEQICTVHNQLKVGDKIVLIKKKGGQKYLIVDRVV